MVSIATCCLLDAALSPQRQHDHLCKRLNTSIIMGATRQQLRRIAGSTRSTRPPWLTRNQQGRREPAREPTATGRGSHRPAHREGDQPRQDGQALRDRDDRRALHVRRNEGNAAAEGQLDDIYIVRSNVEPELRRSADGPSLAMQTGRVHVRVVACFQGVDAPLEHTELVGVP